MPIPQLVKMVNCGVMQETESTPEIEQRLYHKYDPNIPVPSARPLCPCPRCFNANYLERVEAVLLNMPAKGYQHALNQMLTPLLTSFCKFNPQMFPLGWVEQMPPELKPNNPIRRIFHHMCVCVHSHLYVEGNEADDVVRSVPCWGEDLVSWLMRRRRRSGDAGIIERKQLVRIEASLHELVGVDVVYRRVYIQISRMMRGEHTLVTPMVLCDYAFSLGRGEHMECVARVFYEWYGKRRSSHSLVSYRIVSYTGALMWEIRIRRLCEIEKRTAMAMALHSRLGAVSGLSVLGADILPVCAPRGVESVLTWRDVMQKWICEDTDEVSS